MKQNKKGVCVTTLALSQPSAIAVRNPNAKRVNRVRFNWFILGATFGIGLSFMLNVFFSAVVVPSYNKFQGEDGNGQIASVTEPDDSDIIVLSANDTASPQTDSASTNNEGDTTDTDTVANTDIEEDTGPAYPKSLELKVASGDTLLNMLVAEGVSYEEAFSIIEALKPTYNPRRIRVGQEIALELSEHDALEGKSTVDHLSIALDSITSVDLQKQKAGAYEVAKVEQELKPELTYAGGTITSSLFATGSDAGVPNGVLAEMVKAYSYDVDFQRQIQNGDYMEVLFDRMISEDGDPVTYGDIHYAQLRLSGEPLKIYRFGENGDWGYYNEKGESVIKALLKTPVNGARISSGYGMRHHPVLGYSKMHKGTDFAAPTDTPIYAAGDGVVDYAGRLGGYGNYVRIKHNGTYKTAYAHAHRIARGIRKGAKVKQGQVIAYVGSTGRSTGPHLHYEVLKGGAQVNPMKVKFPTGKVLAGNELEQFKRHVAKLEHKIAQMPKARSQVASAN